MAWGTSKLKKPKKPLPPKATSPISGPGRGNEGAPLTSTFKTSTIIPRAKDGGGEGKTAAQYKDEGPITSDFGSTTGGAMPGGYTPEGYNSAFWSNPDALSQDFLSGMGINNAQFTNEFAPTVDALMLLTSFLGADATGELLDASGQANQMNDYMAQLMTPGGQALDPSAIMMALANADPNSAAGMALSEMSPSDVANIAMQLVSAAGGNPFQMRGLQAGFEQGARDYNIDFAKGGQGESANPYWQGLPSGPLGQFFGGGG